MVRGALERSRVSLFRSLLTTLRAADSEIQVSRRARVLVSAGLPFLLCSNEGVVELEKLIKKLFFLANLHSGS